MLKIAAAAVWIAAATAGSIFYAFQQAGDGEDASVVDMVANPFGGLDYVRLNIISVPQVRNGEVQGYFLARLVFTASAQRLAELKIPADALMTDAVYSELYAHPAIDISSIERLDVDAFRAKLRNAVNAKIGEDLVEDVLIEQVDFLTKTDIRRASFRGWDRAGQPEPEPAGKSASAH